MAEPQSQSEVKKYSKVSSALKCQLFKLVYLNKMSIKDAAKLSNLNYSTAKSVLKNMSQKEYNFIFNELQSQGELSKIKKCPWKKSTVSSKAITATLSDKDSYNSSALQGAQFSKCPFSMNKSLMPKPISIVSSIGFDFFNVQNNEKNAPKDDFQFSCPFLNRKGFSSVLDLKKISQTGIEIPQECPYRIYCEKKSQQSVRQLFTDEKSSGNTKK